MLHCPVWWTIFVGVPAASDKVFLLFPQLVCLGNLWSPFDQPLWAKNIFHERRGGKCAQRFLLLEAKTYSAFSFFFFFFLLACSPPVQSYKRFSHFLPPLCSCMSFISFSTPFFVASSLRTPGQMLNQFSLREWEQSWSLYERAYSHITPFSSHKNTEIVVIFHLFYSFIFLPFTVIFIFKFQDLSMPSIINVNRN